jgi:hypothetical protein
MVWVVYRPCIASPWHMSQKKFVTNMCRWANLIHAFANKFIQTRHTLSAKQVKGNIQGQEFTSSTSFIACLTIVCLPSNVWIHSQLMPVANDFYLMMVDTFEGR